MSITISALILGGISGGHFNPAITIAVWLKERKVVKKNAEGFLRTENLVENFYFMLMIMASQVIGAILGVILVTGGIY